MIKNLLFLVLLLYGNSITSADQADSPELSKQLAIENIENAEKELTAIAEKIKRKDSEIADAEKQVADIHTTKNTIQLKLQPEDKEKILQELEKNIEVIVEKSKNLKNQVGGLLAERAKIQEILKQLKPIETVATEPSAIKIEASPEEKAAKIKLPAMPKFIEKEASQKNGYATSLAAKIETVPPITPAANPAVLPAAPAQQALPAPSAPLIQPTGAPATESKFSIRPGQQVVTPTTPVIPVPPLPVAMPGQVPPVPMPVMYPASPVIGQYQALPAPAPYYIPVAASGTLPVATATAAKPSTQTATVI